MLSLPRFRRVLQSTLWSFVKCEISWRRFSLWKLIFHFYHCCHTTLLYKLSVGTYCRSVGNIQTYPSTYGRRGNVATNEGEWFQMIQQLFYNRGWKWVKVWFGMFFFHSKMLFLDYSAFITSQKYNIIPWNKTMF